MHITRVDDYQCWMIELGERRLLIDPWLTDRFSLPLGSWFFSRVHRAPPAFTPESLPPLDMVILTSHFADHLDPPTLRRLPPTTPIVGSAAAAKAARGLGFERVTALAPDGNVDLEGGHRLRAVAPAFPYAHNALGFVFEEADGPKAYLETHVADDRRARSIGPVDIAILPVEAVRLLGVMFAMDAPRAARVATAAGAQWVTPTGLDPGAAEGWFARWVLHCRGSVEDFERVLENGGPQLLRLETGVRTRIPMS